MNDIKQIQLLKDAVELYEDGAILEAKDKAIEFINNITDFENALYQKNDEIVSCIDCKYYPNGIPCNDCEGYNNFVRW